MRSYCVYLEASGSVNNHYCSHLVSAQYAPNASDGFDPVWLFSYFTYCIWFLFFPIAAPYQATAAAAAAIAYDNDDTDDASVPIWRMRR